MPDSENGVVRSYPSFSARESSGLTVSGLSDKGPKRLINEDRWTQFESFWGACILVADGLGGQKAGERAADLVVELLPRYVSESSPEADFADVIRRATAHTNREIYDEGQSSPEKHGMGSTMVLALISPDSVTIAHCGDSRAYLHSRGKLSLLTNDHTLGREMVASGVLTEKMARKHSKAGLLTRCIGVHEEVEVDIRSLPRLGPGESIVLCSDGLSRHTSEQEMRQAFARHSSADGAASALLALGLTRSTDNVTVVVARAEGGSESEAATFPPAGSALLRSRKALAGISVAAVSAAVLLLYYGSHGKAMRPAGGPSAAATSTGVSAPAPQVSSDSAPKPVLKKEPAVTVRRGRVLVQLLAGRGSLPAGSKKWLTEWTKANPGTLKRDLRYPGYYADAGDASGGTLVQLKSKMQKAVAIVYNQRCSGAEVDDLVRDLSRSTGLAPGVISFEENSTGLGRLSSDLSDPKKDVCAVVLLDAPSRNSEP